MRTKYILQPINEQRPTSDIDFKKLIKRKKRKELNNSNISMVMVMSNLMTKRGASKKK
jgi:hypothetical protein